MKNKFWVFASIVVIISKFISCVSLQEMSVNVPEQQNMQVLGQVSTSFTSFHFFHAYNREKLKNRIYVELSRNARQRYPGNNVDVRNIVITGHYSPWNIPFHWAYLASPIILNIQRIRATGDVVIFNDNLQTMDMSQAQNLSPPSPVSPAIQVSPSSPVSPENQTTAPAQNLSAGFLFENGTILGYTDMLSNPTDMVIPSEINGIRVTAIGNRAFERLNLTSVVIPTSVTQIGANAFPTSTSLARIIIGGNVSMQPNSFGGHFIGSYNRNNMRAGTYTFRIGAGWEHNP